MEAGRFVAGARDVFRVAAVIAMNALGRQLQHAVGQRGEEAPVVRNEQHRALVLRQRRDQHLLGHQVEVVGRLVEHEEIRRIVKHDRHDQPRLLAARQHAALLLDVVARKAEAAGERAQRTLAGLREGVLQRLEDAAVAVEQIHRVLGEIAHLDAGADGDVAGVRLRRARHQLQQRRLAGAVDAHHRPALAAAHLEVQPLVDAARAIAFVDALQRRHVVAGARRGRKFEQDRLAAPRRLDALDLVELLHPALHLRGVRGARLETLDELDFLGQHRLLALELRLLLLLVLRPLLFVEFVIAGKRGQRAAVDLDHLGDDAVHELAVVRGHQQRPLVALEERLEPDQAFEIEMVARLVEQHGVGAHQQDAAERHPHLPAAGERADVALHHLLAEAQAGQHFARLGLERVAAEVLEAAVRLAVALDDRVEVVGLVGIGHRRFQFAQLGGHGAHRAGAVHHFGDGAAARHLADVLAEIADGDAAIDRHLAFVGRSSPVIMRKSVVLPAPLGPTRPTFSPFHSAAEASMKRR